MCISYSFLSFKFETNPTFLLWFPLWEKLNFATSLWWQSSFSKVAYCSCWATLEERFSIYSLKLSQQWLIRLLTQSVLLKKKFLSNLEKCNCYIYLHEVQLTTQCTIVEPLFHYQLIVYTIYYRDYIFLTFNYFSFYYFVKLVTVLQLHKLPNL